MSTTTFSIGQIHLVMVPSSDQARSVAFYEQLGFRVQADVPFDAGRWIELVPPNGTTGVALAPGRPEQPGTQTGIVVTVDDVDAARAWMEEQGLDVDSAVAREGSPAEIRLAGVAIVGPTPAMFYVRDPDGNQLLVVG